MTRAAGLVRRTLPIVVSVGVLGFLFVAIDGRAVVKELKVEKKFRTVCIDTVDNLWKFCVNYVCAKFDMQHPSDQEWGKGWDLCKDEWRKVLVPLSMYGYGLLFISHEQERTTNTRTKKIDKTMPTIPGSARSVILPMCDIIAHLGIREVEVDGETEELRVATFQPTEAIEAGDRTGKLPPRMKMGKSAQEFYDNFHKKFQKGGKNGRS